MAGNLTTPLQTPSKPTRVNSGTLVARVCRCETMSISQVGCLVGTVGIPTVNLAFAQGPISAGSSTRLDRSLAQPCCSSNRSVELSSRRLKCKRRVGRSVHRPIKWLVANPTQSPRANFPYLELARSSHRLLCITGVTPRAVSSACLLTRPPAGIQAAFLIVTGMIQYVACGNPPASFG